MRLRDVLQRKARELILHDLEWWEWMNRFKDLLVLLRLGWVGWWVGIREAGKEGL